MNCNIKFKTIIHTMLVSYFSCLTLNAYAQSQSQNLSLQQNSLEELCIMSGIVQQSGSLLTIDDGGTRVQVKVTDHQAAQIQFKYLGHSTSNKPLASGEVRRQIGLKLNAQDTCNVIYIMWQIEENSSQLRVSFKLNNDMNTHKQCGAGGYKSITPILNKPIPNIAIGSWHNLLAQIAGEDLLVYADNQLVWRGVLPKEALSLKGPVGFRTDNGKFELKFNSIKTTPLLDSSNVCKIR